MEVQKIENVVTMFREIPWLVLSISKAIASISRASAYTGGSALRAAM